VVQRSDMVSSTRPLRVEREERIYEASQWQLMWLRFRKHRLALVGSLVVVLMYTVALLAPFLAPYDKFADHSDYVYCPPQRIHFFDGQRFYLRPFVYGLNPSVDSEAFTNVYEVDKSRKYFLRLFVRRSKYKLLGLISTDLHLFGIEEGGTMFLLGTDSVGRDLLSRILTGASISLSIGFVGVIVSFCLGIVIGAVSGYYGGIVDLVIQRIIEFLLSIPSIPLWMALSAAVPTTWPPLKTYFAITVILSLQGWTGLARVVRGKLLELREEDFVMAARLAGSSDWRIMMRHMVPAFMSYLIVNMTLAIPNMVLGETALSFLGLGLRPPVVSWGVLLNDAQHVHVIMSRPWLLAPAFFVVFTMLSFNFMGDGLRDAADPYKF